jgi:hypothetical protein
MEENHDESLILNLKTHFPRSFQLTARLDLLYGLQETYFTNHRHMNLAVSFPHCAFNL